MLHHYIVERKRDCSVRCCALSAAAAAASSRASARSLPMRSSSAGHLGPAFAAGQRQPQRLEQRLALAAGRCLERVGERVPGIGGPVDRRRRPRPPRATKARSSSAELGRARSSPSRTRMPVGELAEPLEIGAKQQPVLLVAPGREGGRRPRRNRAWWSSRALSSSTSCEVEMRRRAAEMREVEVCARARRGWRPARPAATCRAARAATAAPSARAPPRADASTPSEPSRFDNLPSAATSKASCAKSRRLGAQRLEHLDLRRAVRDMVLAAHDVGDAQVDVVDHARQQIEPAAVVAADHRVGQQLAGRTSARRGRGRSRRSARHGRAGSASAARGPPAPAQSPSGLRS